MNYSDRDNGVLSSNAPHGAGFTIAVVIHSVDPLERGTLDMSHSIDILGSLSHSLFTRLILWIEERDFD